MGVLDNKKDKYVKALKELITQNKNSEIIQEAKIYLNSDKSFEDLEFFGEELYFTILRKMISKKVPIYNLPIIKKLYSSTCLDNTNLEQLSVFNQFFELYSIAPILFKNDSFVPVIAAFDNKEVALNFYRHLFYQGYDKAKDYALEERVEKNLYKILAFPINVRKFYVKDTMLFSSCVSLCQNLTPQFIFMAEEDQVDKIIQNSIKEAKKQSGIYDIDHDMIAEFDANLHSTDSRYERFNNLMAAADAVEKSLTSSVGAAKDAVDISKKNAVLELETKLESMLLELKTSYGEVLDGYKNEISKETVKNLASIRNLLVEVIAGINTATEVNLEKLEDFVTNSEELKTLLSEVNSNKEFVERVARLDEKLMKHDSIVKESDPSKIFVATATLELPSYYRPVQYAKETGEFQPVNHFFDKKISFTSRLNEFIEKKEKLALKKGYVYHEKFDDIAVMVMEGMNPYLIGPSGCGKTFLVGQISEILDLDYTDIGYINEEYDLIGYKTATGDFSRTNFYDAYKYGIIAFCDELDNGNAAATVKLNSFASKDKNASYCFPNGEKVSRHPNFRIIAAGNTDGNGATEEYSSRQKIEESVQQRLTPIYLGYDNRIEEKILKKYPDWYEFVVAFRKATDSYALDSQKDSVSGIITTRDAEQIRDLLDDNSFGKESTEKIIDYMFIQTKNLDYLARLEDEINNQTFTKGKKQAEVFVKKIGQIRENRGRR